MKTLKKPNWQFVAVVVSVIALIMTVSLFWIGRPVKRLQVEILSNSPLISVNTDISSKIQILFKDKPVHSLSLILLKFENVGNEPILGTDYSQPIHILLSANAEVLEVTVQETKPEGILLNPTAIAANQVEMAKALLNPGDQAIIRVLALNNDGTFRIEARIVGISNIEILSTLKSDTERNDSASAWILVVGLGTVIMILLSFFTWNSRQVIEWRRSHLGFDPARYFYTLAQETMLSKDNSIGITNTMFYLEKAFKWDKSYTQRAQQGPLFFKLHQYEKFKSLIDKHKLAESPSADTP